MDFSQEFIIDWSLNVAGYVVAGLLSVALYSLFNRTKKSASLSAPDRITETLAHDTAMPSPRTFSSNRKIEFVKLGESAPNNTRRNDTESNPENLTGAIRRNRSEVLKIAREMLNAGATHDKIRNELPVSETELSLLSMNKN